MGNVLCKVGKTLYSVKKTVGPGDESVYYNSLGFDSICDHWSSELLVAKRIVENTELFALFSLYNDGGGMTNDYYSKDKSEDFGPFVYEDLRLSCDFSDAEGIGFAAATKNGKWGVIRYHLPRFSSRVDCKVVAPFRFSSFDKAVSHIVGEYKPLYEWHAPVMTEYLFDDLSKEEMLALGFEKVVYEDEIRKRAENGEAVYQAILSLCYFYGSGIPRDLRSSYLWATDAAKNGWVNSTENDMTHIIPALVREDYAFLWERVLMRDTIAMVDLAVESHLGVNMKQNDVLSKQLLQWSIEAGSDEAKGLMNLYFGE